jgi:hypothetical protein
VSEDLNCGASEDNDMILDDMDLGTDVVQSGSDGSDDDSTDVDIDWEAGVQDVSEQSDASGSEDDDELMGMYEMYGQ